MLPLVDDVQHLHEVVLLESLQGGSATVRVQVQALAERAGGSRVVILELLESTELVTTLTAFTVRTSLTHGGYSLSIVG